MKRILLYLLYIYIHVCAGTTVLAQTDHFRHVSIDEGLAGDCVYRILKDSRGLTWVGTNRGVSLYDGQHVTSIPCDVRRSMNLVHDIVELSNGNIVVAMRAGLFQVKSERVKSEKLELVACPLSISVTDARSLLVMGDTLLVGSAEGLFIAALKVVVALESSCVAASTWLCVDSASQTACVLAIADRNVFTAAVG